MKMGMCLLGSKKIIFDKITPVWQHTFVSPSAFSRRAVVNYWRKYVHEVLVNRLGGLSLPRKSVVRLTDRPDMTLDVYRGRKTTNQHEQQNYSILDLDNFQVWLQYGVASLCNQLLPEFSSNQFETFQASNLKLFTDVISMLKMCM